MATMIQAVGTRFQAISETTITYLIGKLYTSQFSVPTNEPSEITTTDIGANIEDDPNIRLNDIQPPRADAQDPIGLNTSFENSISHPLTDLEISQDIVKTPHETTNQQSAVIPQSTAVAVDIRSSTITSEQLLEHPEQSSDRLEQSSDRLEQSSDHLEQSSGHPSSSSRIEPDTSHNTNNVTTRPGNNTSLPIDAHPSISPAVSDNIGALEVVRPIYDKSPYVYLLYEDVYVGFRSRIALPAMLEEEWQKYRRQKLILDLKEAIERISGRVRGRGALIEPWLCMTGRAPATAREVRLRPTIWIRCGSKVCRKSIQRDLKNLSDLGDFAPGGVQIQPNAPRFASRIRSASPRPTSQFLGPYLGSSQSMSEESQPPGSSAQRSVEIRVLLPNVPLLSPSRYSACGNKVKYVSTQNGSERICLIGGIITVDDVVYGLTAAHILRDELFEDDLFEDDDSTFSELIDQLEVPNAADCPVTIDQQVLPVVSHISGQESFTWQTATVGHMMYAGTTIADLEANSKTKLGGSDFALVSMESSTRLLLQNIYFFSPSQSDGNGSDVCIIDSFAESIEPGKVSIICSPSDVIEGYLLPGDDLFLEGVNVFSTRKIETSRRLETGTSGTWVVRGSSLLGMIIAVYDHEHYAHMLTIEFIVSDIKELFATKYGRTPLVGLPDQRITCCTGESSENSLLIRNYTAAAPSPELLHEPSLDQPLAHKDRTASPTVPSEQVARESIGFDLTRNTNLKKKSANSEHGDSFDPPSAHQSSAKPNKINGFRLVLKMAALCLATFIVGMDTTSFSTTLPIIVDHLKSLDNVGWYGTAYLSAASATYLSMPILLYMTPHISLLLICLLTFDLGALICSLAPRSFVIIIGRIICGIGAASTLFYATYCAYHITSGRKSRINVWIVVHSYGLGRLIGPIIGGALAEKITWRWSFYGVVFIGAFALSLMAFISMNEPNRKFLWHVLRNIRPSDFVLLFSRQVGLVGSLVCLCLTLYLGESSDWRYPAFIPLIIVAVALIIGICFLEWIFRLDPYSPFRKFDRRTWSLVALSAMWGASLSVWNQFLPLWIQTVKGNRPLISGLYYLATTITLFVVSLAKIRLPRPDVSFSRLILFVSLAAMALSSGMSSNFTPGTEHFAVIVWQIIFGLGAGGGAFQGILGILAPPELNVPERMSGDSRVIGDSELGHTSPTGVATVDPDFENEGPSQPLTIYDLNLETEPIPLYQEFPNISGGRTTEEARPSTTERTATSAEAQNCHHTLLLKVCCVLLGESLGGAIGISIAETILLSRLKVIDPELAANGNILSLSKSFDGVQLERASSALSQAITRTFLVCTAAAGLPWALGMLWLLVLGVRRILRKCLEAWKRRGEVKTTKSSSSGPELRRRSAAVGPEIRKLRREPLLEIT